MPVQALDDYYALVRDDRADASLLREEARLIEEIQELKRRRNAVVLAHNYQRTNIFEAADFMGDSYALSVSARKSARDTIVFCGVRFMAETAAILCPQAVTLLPEPMAGCGLADAITAQDVRDLKSKHPGAPAVMYINCTAEVKAEADAICTSANALKVVEGMPGDAVIFGPDANLADFVARRTSKKIIKWEGYCPVHKEITLEMLEETMQKHPDAVIIVHPECAPEVIDRADEVMSTNGMVEFVKASPRGRFIIGTEIGLIQKLSKDFPEKEIHPIYRHQSCDQACACPYMKLTTLRSVKNALEFMQYRIEVEEPTRSRARRALEKMIEICS